MSKGWISLHRQIWNSWVWDDKPFSKGQAWIDLLLLANHEPNKTLIGNQIIHVKRGELISSEVKLSERWGWSRKKTREFLKVLQSDGMITKKSTSKYTAITIVNYEIYQGVGTTKEQQKNSRGTAMEQQWNTNNNDNNVNNDNKDIYNKSDSTNPTQPAQNTKADTTTPQELIFRHWNSKNIIQHRKLTDKIKRAINGALQDYSKEEICQAIDNYAVILADDRYYWSYKWGLKEFLQRGLDKFLDFDVAAQNYRKDDREKQKMNKRTDFNKFEQHEYTADELESLFMKIEGG